ncbi:Reverse transcriptase (RNA-dependent DNA polymerase), partial [Phytophthora infestans]
ADRDSESVATECGYSVANECGSDSEINDAELASGHLSGPVIDESGLVADEEREISIHEDTDTSADDSGSAIISACAEIMGKRPRKEAGSEEIAELEGPKRTRTGLREYHERHRPKYLDDYVVKDLQNTPHVLDENGRSLRATDVQIPRNHREAMRSKYHDYWREAELAEMSAIRRRSVLEGIAVRSDFRSYVIRSKARLVALSYYQKPGVDFVDTFSPAARISSFRLLVALISL